MAKIISGTDDRPDHAGRDPRISEIRGGPVEAFGTSGSPGVGPGLATVLVGDDPASRAYVGMKNRAAAEVGIHSRQIDLPGRRSEDELLGWWRG
jgi:hypothetical protein